MTERDSDGPAEQEALYPRRLAQAEALVFAIGVETIVAGTFLGNAAAARGGAILLVGAAALAIASAAWVWTQRSGGRDGSD